MWLSCIKRLGTTLLTEYICSIVAKISFECRHKTNIPLNLTVTGNGWGEECTEVCSSR